MQTKVTLKERQWLFHFFAPRWFLITVLVLRLARRILRSVRDIQKKNASRGESFRSRAPTMAEKERRLRRRRPGAKEWALLSASIVPTARPKHERECVNTGGAYATGSTPMRARWHNFYRSAAQARRLMQIEYMCVVGSAPSVFSFVASGSPDRVARPRFQSDPTVWATWRSKILWIPCRYRNQIVVILKYVLFILSVLSKLMKQKNDKRFHRSLLIESQPVRNFKMMALMTNMHS